MAFQSLSESVYVDMCRTMGTPQQVVCRRDMVDITELLKNEIMKKSNKQEMLSGSRREGFRFRESDRDTMFWLDNHKVIWDWNSQSQCYNLQRHALILCHDSESPPGFTLLCLPMGRADSRVLSACVRMNGILYISSSKHRNIYCSAIRPNSSLHGPCSNGMLGRVEVDYAHSFISDFWPPSASSWIDRCHSWPPSPVVNDIVRHGCHFVAIGHKLGNHADNEWRISFSLAEYKLVYSMNHTQFLTYGMLKLFLKEVMNNGLRDDEKLLCSYHLKTTLFWAIQQTPLHNWCPQNLLAGFWVCFKYLLKWVYKGACPNFFIPSNNMFLSNIHGRAKSTLFRRLYGLYEKGIAMLLHSTSIRSSIIDILCNPRLEVCTDEHTLISEVDFDAGLFTEIDSNDSSSGEHFQYILKGLLVIEKLINLPLTNYQVVMLQKRFATILQGLVFGLQNKYFNGVNNKEVYIRDKISLNVLKLSAKFGYVSDTLYIAMFYYKTLRYRETVTVIEKTKVKFAQPHLAYRRIHTERYNEAVGGLPWSTKIRLAIANNIRLANYIFYIPELIPEQKSSDGMNRDSLMISPFIMLHFLEFLSCRRNDSIRAQAALENLQVLVQNEHLGLVHEDIRDISWEMLGIIQEMSGDIPAAVYSFQQSLRQLSIHEIQSATRQRIRDLH
ncbi:uncharacterized protein LOC128177636 [Crassostrea angulata]|uniref:uncharacterized protein LOC128177636 n=1 Tax=Magallana angulata TaxID=2784310 RepID=UPI0022B21471|nr:uncharacterized protein LOC128177636 [Crassostrea angulata]XP_052700394.1 uncharacterized protein LOC128177636 [Crassostrea angulata]